MNIFRSYVSKLKTRKRTNTLRALGGWGRIFLKSLPDTSFTKDLSNEPNFGRIHLAGQYLSMEKAYSLCKNGN
jgi:hypothetical protein